MNVILLILTVLGLIIATILIAAVFVQKEYRVHREIIINKPRAGIFNFIKYLRNQDSFSKWATMDPEMKKEYKGTDGAPGFVSAWDSKVKNVGQGEQQITLIIENERIESALKFIKPFPGKAKAIMSTESVDENHTRVKWILESGMKYPMNIMLLFMNMDKMMGKDLEEGLKNLKTLQEKI